MGGVSFLNLGQRHNGPVDMAGRVNSEVQSYCAKRHNQHGRTTTGDIQASWSVFRGASTLMRISNRTPSGAYCQWLELAWELLFGTPLRLPEDDYGGYDYGQFVVTREAVQRRPQAFWARAWRALCSQNNYLLLP